MGLVQDAVNVLTLFPKKAGIYGIRNARNGKIYIGSTNNLYRRINKHFWELNKNIHCNKHFQNSYNKNEGKEFYPFVYELCELENISEREQAYLDFYESYKNNKGFNCQIKAYSNQGMKLSEETKKKIGNYFRGKPKSDEAKLKNRLSHLGEKNGQFGKRPSEKVIKNLIEINIKSRKEYTFISPEGKTITFVGLSLFCKENNLSAASMSHVYLKKQSNHKGWTIPGSQMKMRFRKRR
jgi:group I intron endonuclease